MSKRKAEAVVSEIKKGDVVEIKPEYLKKRIKKGSFTPADLVGIGWPNRFQVLQVGVVEEGDEGVAGEPILTLDPCCLWMLAENKEDYLCKAHPAERFQLASAPRKKAASTKNLTIRTAMGKLFQVDYSDDEDEPCMEIQVGDGDPLILGGKISKVLWEKFRSAGVL